MKREQLSRLASAGSESLPGDHVSLTARRLGIAASVTGGIYLLYLVLYQTLWRAEAHPVGQAAGIVGVVLSAATAAYLLSAQRSRAGVTLAGVGYELGLALILAISEASTLDYSRPSAQVSWAAVVIVLFPFLIPAGPRAVLGASLGAAAMMPLGMGLVFGLSGKAWPGVDVISSVLVPPVACALLAWAPAHAIHRLGAAVQQARRLGNYELAERLGGGGMGEVWRARHRLLARPAAVKLIKPEMLGARDEASREQVRARFEQEARVTASLDSAHTVELYDFGASSGGELFIVMELLDGLDAETLVERHGVLPSERVVYLLMQACDSLEDAHRRGLVHRDIKPANLFIARKGVEFDVLKVLDFGLVKRWHAPDAAGLGRSLASVLQGAEGGVAAAGSPPAQTAVGQIVGTPAFIAPEAAMNAESVDQRADLYALGCVSYWLLTGQQVFAGQSALELLVAHVTRAPEPPSARGVAIDPELERITLACLAKDRDARPQSARELRERLAAITFESPWTRERAVDWWRERRGAS